MSTSSAANRIRVDHRVADQGAADQTGFTLVELMVVVAVVMLLLLIAVPSFADMIDRARVRGAAGAAISLLAEARGGSVLSNSDVAISFGGTAPAWCIGANGAVTPAPGTAIPPAGICDCTTATNCTILNGTTGLQTNVALESTDYTGVTSNAAPANNFTFDGRLGDMKLLIPTNVVFTSPKGKYQIQLSVAPLGQASLCIPAGQPDIPGISSC